MAWRAANNKRGVRTYVSPGVASLQGTHIDQVLLLVRTTYVYTPVYTYVCTYVCIRLCCTYVERRENKEW